LMLDVLADHLEEPWPVSDTVGGLVIWGAELARRYDPLDDAIEEYWGGVVAESLEGDVVRRVTRTGRELIRYTQVAFAPGSPERPRREEVAITSELRDKAIVALEDGILALDRSMEMRALRELSEDVRELATTAENLREMMEGDPDAQEMFARLDRLERQLAQMMESAARLKEGGLKEFVNQRQGELQSLIDEIREAIAEGRLDDARELMEQLTRQIQQLSEGIQDNLEQMMAEESDAMAQAQDFLEQLEELEEKQLALQEEVRELRQQGDAGSAERAEQLWEEIERRAERLAERGQAYGEGLEKAGRAFHEQEVAGAASDQLEHLRESASARDLNGVRQTIPRAQLDWRLAEARHEREAARARGKLSGPGQREVWQIQRELQELEELVEALEQTSSGLDPETQEQVRGQRQRQQQLEGELQGARQQARQLQQGFPVRPEGLQEGLRDAGEQMGQASEDLGHARPMQAEGAQEMAAQRIRDARESLERAMEQARQQAMQLSEPSQREPCDECDGGEGSRDSRAEVEIPSPEEFRTPEEYRRALLEGMQRRGGGGLHQSGPSLSGGQRRALRGGGGGGPRSRHLRGPGRGGICRGGRLLRRPVRGSPRSGHPRGGGRLGGPLRRGGALRAHPRGHRGLDRYRARTIPCSLPARDRRGAPRRRGEDAGAVGAQRHPVAGGSASGPAGPGGLPRWPVLHRRLVPEQA
ncbi:MAG: hypothetical protein JRJ84_01885, partial [Deltaproteobacteria bacterium]|nr:hypothetical protein [Deltaproteobacteria bacterium]